MKRILDNSETYFIAANGFDGFCSNFKYALNPNDLDRIFILKGGPGTGKSTLMKHIAEHFISNGIEVKKYLCSSDPKSYADSKEGRHLR